MAPGAQLAEEIRTVVRFGRIPIVTAHELDPGRNGCSFEELLRNTPQDLISLGIYKNKRAIPCHADPLQRSVSLTLIAMELGAVSVQPLLRQIAASPAKAVRRASKALTSKSPHNRKKSSSFLSGSSSPRFTREPSSTAAIDDVSVSLGETSSQEELNSVPASSRDTPYASQYSFLSNPERV